MKVKPDLEVSSYDFWYDLTKGYIKPSEILEDPDDVKRVEEAVKTLEAFESACNSIEGFEQ